MKEADLAKPVADWLRLDGFTVYSEVPFWHRCIDMVGLKNNKLRIVELKLRYCASGVKQAMIGQLATKDVYLVVGKRPRNSSIDFCEKYGIGLLVVGKVVDRLLLPNQVYKPSETAIEHLIENCLVNEPSDEAGLPCMSGCGPAQFVGAMVKDYVKKNPKAGWKEIYENVENHYSNHFSMSGAMCSYLGITLTKLRSGIGE